MSARRGLGCLLMTLALTALAGCGSSSGSGVSVPTVGAARVFALSGFQPAAAVHAGQPVAIQFTITTPAGRPLTQYRTGAGPHTGVHLIIVRDDLAYIIHQHPPIGPGGRLRQVVRFPAPGRYRVLVDAYPNLPGGQPNFQLFRTVQVAGAYKPKSLPPFQAAQVVDGFHFQMQGQPKLHAVQAQFVHVSVTDPQGRPVNFKPWFGALAHAIFFHQGSLDYFHTHVCGAGAPNCATAFGGARIAGTATRPGQLTLGVLLPVPGVWRLFLQMKVAGQVITAPYTLRVS